MQQQATTDNKYSFSDDEDALVLSRSVVCDCSWLVAPRSSSRDQGTIDYDCSRRAEQHGIRHVTAELTVCVATVPEQTALPFVYLCQKKAVMFVFACLGVSKINQEVVFKMHTSILNSYTYFMLAN